MWDAKTRDITVPCTAEIRNAIKLAKDDANRPDGVGTGPEDLIWPGCLNNPTRDELPARGHALRRTHRTIAIDHCDVSDGIAAALQGRAPPGVEARYILKWARTEGPKIIEAQQKISRTIMQLLKAKPARGAKLKRAA
jgi:hypothetical protein